MLRAALFAPLFFFAVSIAATEAIPARRPAPAAGKPEEAAASKEKPNPRPSERLRERAQKLPAAPEGVTDLFFDEFFKTPVGPRGLDMTDRLTEMNGKKVRILGYMVRQSKATPWTLLLAPMPLIAHEGEFALAEDLPPSTVRVLLPRNSNPITPYTPGLLLLTGKLDIGDREEADGRHSLVRLHLDPPPAPSAQAAASTNTPAAITQLSASEPVRR